MKRRGFGPSSHTYKTLLNGFSRSQVTEKNPLRLERAQSLYESYLEHVKDLKALDPNHHGLSVQPINYYIEILGSARLKQKMWDVFYALDKEGPMAPTEYTFTMMFRAILYRHDSKDASGDGASEASLLWRQMLKASERVGFAIDSHAVVAALKLLGRGHPTDQTLAFNIIHDYLGLSKPGVDAKPARVPLNEFTMEAVLNLCDTMQKPRWCIHYIRQIMDDEERAHILDNSHMKFLFASYLDIAAGGSTEGSQAVRALRWMRVRRSLAKDKLDALRIQPTSRIYNLVIATCQKCKDWQSMCAALNIITGIQSSDFLDDIPTPPVDSPVRWKTNVVTLTQILRCAIAARDPAHARQCLRMLDYIGIDRIFFDVIEAPGQPEDSDSNPYESVSELGTHRSTNGQDRGRDEDYKQFAAEKLRSLVTIGLQDHRRYFDAESVLRFQSWKQRANEVLQHGKPSKS